MKQKLLKFFLILFTLSGAVSAQTRTVTGVVTGKDDGSPLSGVSVMVQGTKIGTQTGTDGRYSITAPSGNSTLVFSFIGFTTQEVSARSVINISLVPT